jgi:cysteinyl-tRNA synthetase
MIEFVKALEEKGLAYEASDGVYFDISKFDGYGELSGIDTSKVEKTERMTRDDYDKETVNDFSLWKKATPEELERGIYYDSPWGKGRPGWHIECSVMSKSLLGDQLDIHAGGEDLAFPHHENEIAQTESLTGKTFVRYWIHVRHLMINGRKMSKSLGNYVGFDEVLNRYSPDAFRYFYLKVHYRRPLDYTEAAMESAENSVRRLAMTLDLIEDALRKEDRHLSYGESEKGLLKAAKTHRERFEEAMDDDLDTHRAIDALHALSGSINEYLSGPANKGVVTKAGAVYRELLATLGLFEGRGVGADEFTEALIQTIADVREKLRGEKRFELSDMIREVLRDAGVILSDTEEGTSWRIEDK